MNLPRRCIATKALQLAAALFASLFAATLAFAAQVAGTVTHLSGPLLAKKADGVVKVLSVKSTVDEGDTLVTEKDTYARIKFIDNSEITLRPGSQLKIDSFSFDEAKPEKDSAAFSLVKGGLRAITGTLGKRNHERFGMNTPAATIGIRGTIFIVEYVAPDAAAVAAYGRASVASVAASWSNASTRSDMFWNGAPLEVLPIRVAQAAPLPGPNLRPPGLYVQVLDGMIHLNNGGGSQNFSAGQFGYTRNSQQPPIVLPTNPGMQFSPPSAFSAAARAQDGQGASNSNANAVDCEVR